MGSKLKRMDNQIKSAIEVSETLVLTVVYNMLSGYFKTTQTEILSCFKKKQHTEVKAALNGLLSTGIMYWVDRRYYINWESFKDEMINQDLVS